MRPTQTKMYVSAPRTTTTKQMKYNLALAMVFVSCVFSQLCLTFEFSFGYDFMSRLTKEEQYYVIKIIPFQYHRKVSAVLIKLEPELEKQCG